MMEVVAVQTIVRAGNARRVELRSFLKELRQRIRPEARALGAAQRLPARCGKPVTQEEVAEAIGVSRVWYGMLESGAMIRTSAQLLDRLAEALMLTPQERAILFCLAIPELQQLFHDSGASTLLSSRLA